MVTAAVCITPPMEAEIETGVSAATGCRLIGKLTLFAPAGTVTLAGNETSAPFEEDRLTFADESAGPLSTTVPCAVKPPNWPAGLTVRPLNAYGATSARFAACVTELYVAEMITEDAWTTAAVDT